MNYFLHSEGPIANDTRLLGWVFAGICVMVCLVVAGMLLYAMLRQRDEDDTAPVLGSADRHAAGDVDDAPIAGAKAGSDPDITSAFGPVSRGASGSGLQAIATGTVISTLLLIGMAIYALVVFERTTHPAAPVALTLDVTGYDWWWRVDYDAAGTDPGVGMATTGGPKAGVVTANEIHIPVGVPVRLRLRSADVIHAFWVPLLAGKTQMIPGLTNEQWLQADKPGVYRGQCTQYCGVQHAHMAVEVVAEPAAQFDAWKAAQRQPVAQAATGSAVSVGRTLFLERCGGCHTVRGTDAAGINGPDLTHLLSRRMIAAGVLTNTPAHLIEWITRAQEFKPGSRMPSMPLTVAESGALSAFLSTLN